MNDLAELHDDLRAVARDLLGKGDLGTALDWRMVVEAGWTGLEVASALGGADATFAEVAVLLEELGRAAARGPYLGGIVLGVGALSLLEPEVGRDLLLSEIAAGVAVPALALSGECVAVPFRLERGELLGRAAFVPDAGGRMLVPALDPEGTPVIVDVPNGLDVEPQPVLDASRSLALVTADGVAASSVWQFEGDPQIGLRRLHDRAAVAVACDSLGLGEAMLDATVAYAGVREQFGRPIGSFQAVKHACADMLVQLTVSRRLISAAVQALCADDPEAGVAASMAKSYVCGAAVDIVGKAMQLHGGMGYTWESGVHLYLKRATLNRALYGSPAAHRARLAERYG